MTKQPKPKTRFFMIDNEFVKDMEGIKIDSSFILDCNVVNVKDVAYLQNRPV